MNTRNFATAAVVILLLTAALVGLFIFQNHTRTTQLSLDLGVFAFQLQKDLSIPVLMAICFSAGALLVGTPLFYRSMSASKRARRLEQQLAMSGGGSSDSWR